MKDFYVTLTNSCKEFPQNSASEFTTRLAESVQFDDPFEVALVEIMFLKNIDNLPLKRVDRTITLMAGGTKEGIAIIPEEHYHREGLIREINSRIEAAVADGKVVSKPYFTVVNERVHFTAGLTSEGLAVEAEITDTLSKTLGFAGKKRIATELAPRHMADKTVKACQYMFVMTDIISEQLVGEKFLPLLRIIGIPPEVPSHELCALQMSHLVYLPLNHCFLRDITIRLTTRTGELIPFKEGFVVMLLHFRPA